MDPRRSIASKRARWQARLRPARPAASQDLARLADHAAPPVEVLGSHCDERGVICGPYDYRYPIEAGYASERTVIRP